MESQHPPATTQPANRTSGPPQPPRKSRTTFTKHQVLVLKREFHKSNYIGRGRMEELASALNLNVNQIRNWFNNNRMKEKEKNNIVERQLMTFPYDISTYHNFLGPRLFGSMLPPPVPHPSLQFYWNMYMVNPSLQSTGVFRGFDYGAHQQQVAAPNTEPKDQMEMSSEDSSDSEIQP